MLHLELVLTDVSTFSYEAICSVTDCWWADSMWQVSWQQRLYGSSWWLWHGSGWVFSRILVVSELILGRALTVRFSKIWRRLFFVLCLLSNFRGLCFLGLGLLTPRIKRQVEAVVELGNFRFFFFFLTHIKKGQIFIKKKENKKKEADFLVPPLLQLLV